VRLLIPALACLALLAAACGGGSEATPTPTIPEGCAELQEGIYLCAKNPPMLPPGATALSGYYEVRSNDQNTGLVVGLPLSSPQTSTLDLGYYSFSDSTGWTGTIGGINLAQNGTVLEGTFPNVPANIIVLYWPQAGSPTP
jgi:hypothetical protein